MNEEQTILWNGTAGPGGIVVVFPGQSFGFVMAASFVEYHFIKPGSQREKAGT